MRETVKGMRFVVLSVFSSDNDSSSSLECRRCPRLGRFKDGPINSETIHGTGFSREGIMLARSLRAVRSKQARLAQNIRLGADRGRLCHSRPKMQEKYSNKQKF